MADKIQSETAGILTMEIKQYIEFKRNSGSQYTTSAFALNAFDKFCAATENRALSPQQVADAWCKQDGGKPKYDDGCSVRQLGQYLTEIGHPKAFTVLSAKGNAPKRIGVTDSPFTAEISDFVECKRQAGRKYFSAEFSLRAFDIFCAMKENEAMSVQQMADAWRVKTSAENGYDISAVREFGRYLTMQGSMKAFMIPYANGAMPKAELTGHAVMLAAEIESFLLKKRHAGLKYRAEGFILNEFNWFCNGRTDPDLQELAEEFLRFLDGCSHGKRKRGIHVIKAFGEYLSERGCPNSFAIVDMSITNGPYAGEIEAFVAFKKSCGYKYSHARNHLRNFDLFCAYEENKSLTPQQLADKWALKRGGENSNTRAGRVGPVRVFGKYLTNAGHSNAFWIADDAVPRKSPSPPYLFSEDDIGMFFHVPL
jgi:hypothetical protein